MLKFKNKKFFKLAIFFSIIFWIIFGLGFEYYLCEGDDSLRISVWLVNIYYKQASPSNTVYSDCGYDSWGLPLAYAQSTHWYGSSIIHVVIFSAVNILFYFITFYVIFLIVDKIIYKNRKS